MRTRQKLTAVGALALATTAVGGGAVVTSHAMADSPTPLKGTMTVISLRNGSDQAVKCVYDDIELPTVSVGGVMAAGDNDIPEGGALAINVESGSGPVDADGEPIPGAVLVSSGTMALPSEWPDPPNIVVDRPFVVSHTTAGETAPGDASLPELPPGGILLDTTDARDGTAEECAAMKPTTAAPPFVTTP